MQPDFYQADNVILNSEIASVKFTCDLTKCKGACCTMESKYGAPLTKEEVEAIAKNYHIIKDFIPEIHQSEIEKHGFWMEIDGELMTRSLNDRECLFVYYDGDIAKCGIEKAYRAGLTDFLKPISCHLFPIRISHFGGPVLRYEKYRDCEPALENGQKTQISVLDFCKESLERQFGSKWFQKIKSLIR